MIPRWRGWISLDATGKFSSRCPFPDRNAAGSFEALLVTLLVIFARTSGHKVTSSGLALPMGRYRAQHGTECHPKGPLSKRVVTMGAARSPHGALRAFTRRKAQCGTKPECGMNPGL